MLNTDKPLYCGHRKPTLDNQCEICKIWVQGDKNVKAMVEAIPSTEEVKLRPKVKNSCSGCGTQTVSPNSFVPKEMIPDGGVWTLDPLPPSTVPGKCAAYVYALMKLVQSNPQYPGGGDGKGIIWVGGGRKYWPGVVIGCKFARQLGCNWPIEFYYRSSTEWIDPTDVDGLDIQIFDLDKIVKHRLIPTGVPGKGGWESKWEALIHTNLDQVLFFDADCYPVTMPCKYFNVLEEAPVVYWEDLDWTWNTIKWDLVYPGGRNGVPPIQGGQFYVDRSRAWPWLVVTNWMCQHSPHYFPRLYGDQDCGVVALSAGGYKYKCLDKAIWPKDSSSFICYADKERKIPFCVHRCQGKFDLDNPPKFKDMLPMEKEAFEIYSGLKEKHAARPK